MAENEKTLAAKTADTTEKKDTVVTPDDKQVLIDDLKKTMHDMGRIPAIIMAPIITYVASQYDKIPEGRRKKLQDIASTLKTKGIKWLASLKTWFAEASTTPPTAPAETGNPAVTPAPTASSTPEITTPAPTPSVIAATTPIKKVAKAPRKKKAVASATPPVKKAAKPATKKAKK